MSDSLILTKAKAFAIRVVRLHKYLREKREATMSKQILRCGTSIGSNLAEAKYAQSLKILRRRGDASIKVYG